ncbi:MAG: NADP-dependent malic enzyme, partial [Sphingobacteriales bacterium]
TAIIVGAALLNASELVNKAFADLKIVVSGAGASAVSCIKILVALGAKQENFVVTDSHGVINASRENLDESKIPLVTKRDIHTLEEAMHGADVFIGLSKGNIVSPEMLLAMAENPIVFALANPDPEIDYPLAMATRKDLIMATGRSDFPNQVNNVLGFPYLFRGALDVRATGINEEMKLAAVRALAELAKKPVPDVVANTYNQPLMGFGKDYIIPKPIDPRLLTIVAPAVAKAAMDSGIAQKNIENWDAYEEELISRVGKDNKLTRSIINTAKKDPKRVVFAEADHPKILKAAQIIKDECIATPILLGNVEKIKSLIAENGLDLDDVEIMDPNTEDEKLKEYGQILYNKRMRRGTTHFEAERLMRMRNYFGAAMVENGDADALISGLTRKYPATIKPALQVIGVDEGFNKVAGMYIMMTKKGPLFFADATVNLDPKAEDLVTITELTSRAVKQLGIEPRIALISYSNFGSTEAEGPREIAKAAKILKEKHPEMIVDGEMQANFAVNNSLLKEYFPFSELADKQVNTLIFPNLASGNIAYKLLQELGGAEAIGPVLLGMKKSVHVLQLGSSVREIVNMVALAVMDAQMKIQK